MTEIFNLEYYYELRSSVTLTNNELIKLTFERKLEQVLKEQLSNKLIKTLIDDNFLKLEKVDSSIPHHTQFECRLIVIKD